MNITFYTDNIDPRIPEMQKKVFEKLGLEILQLKPTNWQGHGGTIDAWLKEFSDPNEVIVLWDIDCIPLNRGVVTASEILAQDGSIVGVAQKASHIPNSIIYAGPAFLAFSMKTYNLLGRPTFACTERSDCAGELTHIAREKGVEVLLLHPTACEKSMWQLDEHTMFGKGTTFGSMTSPNDIYHAFYSRKDNGDMFIKKCEEVLKNNDNKL